MIDKRITLPKIISELNAQYVDKEFYDYFKAAPIEEKLNLLLKLISMGAENLKEIVDDYNDFKEGFAAPLYNDVEKIKKQIKELKD